MTVLWTQRPVQQKKAQMIAVPAAAFLYLASLPQSWPEIIYHFIKQFRQQWEQVCGKLQRGLMVPERSWRSSQTQEHWRQMSPWLFLWKRHHGGCICVHIVTTETWISGGKKKKIAVLCLHIFKKLFKKTFMDVNVIFSSWRTESRPSLKSLN